MLTIHSFIHFSIFQPILVTRSTAVVPVKSKSRFRPPTREPNYKTEKEFLEYARKAGLVIPQERLERPIHLACTGKEQYFWDADSILYCQKSDI